MWRKQHRLAFGLAIPVENYRSYDDIDVNDTFFKFSFNADHRASETFHPHPPVPMY